MNLKKTISSIRTGDIVATPNGSSKGETVTNIFSANDHILVAINNSIFYSLTQPVMTT
jgi:hypothetical protein